MPAARRDKGDGSLRRRPNGTWEARYSYMDAATGKRISKSVYASTQSEVKRKLKQAIAEHEEEPAQEYVEPSEILFGEWLDTWMLEYKKGSVRASTYAAYRHAIECHIRPALGNIELQKLRPEHIQRLMNAMGKPQGGHPALTPWTVLKSKNVISGALEQAIRNRIIPYNPAKAAIPPKLTQKEIQILTPQEQRRFMDGLRGHRLEALYLLALATGMRRGELLALTWDCVDFKGQSIRVKSSISRVKDPDTGKTELLFMEPKTKTGKRQVPILDSLVPVLKRHKQQQDQERLLAGSAWNPRNLVFCSAVGTPIEPRRIGTTLDKITKAVKLPHITFHALRHTFATRMLEAGVPAKVVQEILGHADVTLTLNTYTHVIGTMAHDQMAKIDVLFAYAPNRNMR